MKRKFLTNLIYLCVFVFLAFVGKGVYAGEVPRMSKEELKSLMGDTQVVIIDVRTGWDWRLSGAKIKGALRENPKDVKSWSGKYDKNKTYVLYCA